MLHGVERDYSLVLVVGEEDLLVDRAVADAVGTAREADPEADVHEVFGGSLAPGELAELAAPSLFGGRRVIVIRSAQDVAKGVLGEVTGYAKGLPPDVALVLVHAGGAKGKSLLDAVTQAGAHVITCPKVSKPSERVNFIRAEVRRAGGTITEDAARTLLDAVGNDLRELAGACGQLVSDTAGVVDGAAVARYHRGRAEVSGFTVADRAVEGRSADALEQLRWALTTGVSPVLITSALAQGLRSLSKVGSAPRNLRGPALARELGMPAWKVDRVRQQLRGWTGEGVARALKAVAEADAQVKGGGADPAYALERAIMEIAEARAFR
ncbi:MAG: DNA polymerase III subunit delta [Streptosporangiales bacterium]|nr:DNA polymerase III subunit delta [Streptosporangiales bacterium]